jgi:hypothetical protein
MNEKFRIQICSIKMLYHMLENNKLNKPIAAVLCSEYPVRIQHFENVTYLHLSFEDITEKSVGRKFTTELAVTIVTAVFICLFIAN